MPNTKIIDIDALELANLGKVVRPEDWNALLAYARAVTEENAAIRVWREAWQAHLDATAAYNARVAFARANEGERIGSISVQAEYQLMTDAKNKAYRMLPDLFVLTAPAAQQAQGEAIYRKVIEAIRLADNVGRSRQDNNYAMNRVSVNKLVDLQMEIAAMLKTPDASPAGHDAPGAVPDALRWAGKVVQLYDDACMNSDYMIDANDAEGILNALADYRDKFAAAPNPEKESD